MTAKRLTTGAIALFILVACGADRGQLGTFGTDETSSTGGSSIGSSSPDVASTTRPGAVPQPEEELLARIVSDAAALADVAEEDVRIVVVERKVWPDGSLGCPTPGEVYIQAPVRGFRVVVGAGGSELDYRASARGFFLRCTSPPPPDTAPTS